MEKIFSARIDDSVLLLLDALSKKLKKSKKRIIEEALDLYARDLSGEKGIDIIAETSGCWNRDETPGETVARTRKAFSNNFKRNHT